MGTFKEFNPYSYKIFISKFRGLDNAVPTYLAKSYFQDNLKLLERQKLKMEESPNIEIISAPELQKGLDSGTPFLIFDVRVGNELSGKMGYLENSVNVPVGSLKNRILELENKRDREITIVCCLGIRVVRAAEILARKGFGKMKILRDDMIAWRDLQA